ncbi:beta-lactamase/transpeptidase-like protein [Athelia psychrophila]|uniref:Beta-lactamase/transpeptidase-like protein n=1 Tax=Athelia psychrophila TaxID=1759441 RepID=A0A166B0Q1_9AGAM|nr:beta-lactamase/transpeptidase-like protein [Fibularhizoctonia sp. CBS 109695]
MRFYAIALLYLRSAVLAQDTQVPFQADHKHSTAFTPEISKYIEEALDTYQVPGLSAAVIRKDGTVEVGAWGKSTEDGNRTTPDTLYYIASCSKAFTAAAMGILIGDFEQGRNTTALPADMTALNWNTKVKDLLPAEWALQDEWASEKASIRDIMAHVSGLGRHDLSYGPSLTSSEFVSRLRYLRPSYELREQFSYNNHMFVVAAHIISTYTGSYTRFVKERIFDPLNMTSTTFSLSEAVESGKMTQTWGHLANGRRIPHWMGDHSLDTMAGAGGIISSVIDMAKWVELLLNSGYDTHTNTTIIPKASFEQITSAQVVAFGGPVVAYCAGWIRQTFLGRDTIWHNGGIPGAHAQVAFLPGDGVGLVQLLNIDSRSEAVLDIQQRLFEKALGLEPVSEKLAGPERPPPADTDTNTATIESAPIDVHKYSGTYSHPAYGNLTFCGPHTLSDYCHKTRADFAPFPLGALPQLLATWPRFCSAHGCVVFIDKSSLSVEISTLFPKGYGADESPFTHVMDTGEAGSKFSMDGEEVTVLQLKTADG